MFRKTIILISLIFILVCCDKPIGGEEFFSNITVLENSVNQEDWQGASSDFNNLYNNYKENNWKLQLIGDENEYESLYESIQRLEVAIERKDSTQALMELASIRAFILQIYSM